MDDTATGGCDTPNNLAPLPPEAAEVVAVPGFAPRKITQLQSSAEWRRAFAAYFTVEQKFAIIDTLFRMGVEGQNFQALKELLDRGLGKPGVASDKLVDDMAADVAEAAGLDALSTEELHHYLQMQEKIRRRQVELQSPPEAA